MRNVDIVCMRVSVWVSFRHVIFIGRPRSRVVISGVNISFILVSRFVAIIIIIKSRRGEEAFAFANVKFA